MKVKCPWCRRPRITLRGNGNLWQHQKYSSADNGSLAPVCEGSGKAPGEHPSRRPRQSQA
jgi:hypothetical protein